MDGKGDGEEITYPHVCFTVDNFEDTFEDVIVRDGESVGIELTASAPTGKTKKHALKIYDHFAL